MIEQKEPVWVQYTIPNGLSDDLELRFLLQCVVEHGVRMMPKETVKEIMKQEAEAILAKVEL